MYYREGFGWRGFGILEEVMLVCSLQTRMEQWFLNFAIVLDPDHQGRA